MSIAKKKVLRVIVDLGMIMDLFLMCWFAVAEGNKGSIRNVFEMVFGRDVLFTHWRVVFFGAISGLFWFFIILGPVPPPKPPTEREFFLGKLKETGKLNRMELDWVYSKSLDDALGLAKEKGIWTDSDIEVLQREYKALKSTPEPVGTN